MENQRTNKRNISFIAESKFHDVIDPQLTNKPADLKLIPYYDELYLESIKKIIGKIFDNNLSDEIIVMNDHGPRTMIFGEIVKNPSSDNINKMKVNLKSGSFFDKDYYGIFVSKFDSMTYKKSSNNINNIFLKEYLPINKKRYTINTGGEAIFIKEF